MSTTRQPGPRTRRARFVAGSLGTGALAAVTALAAPTANADYDDYQDFQLPSGNIACQLGTFSDSGVMRATVGCQVGQHDFSAPPHPADCEGAWGDAVGLTQGKLPSLQCHGDTLLGSPEPVLDYGQTRSVGPITCASLQSGIRCTDSSTGHAFSLSRDGYQLS
jgi:hypothetical protein